MRCETVDRKVTSSGEPESEATTHLQSSHGTTCYVRALRWVTNDFCTYNLIYIFVILDMRRLWYGLDINFMRSFSKVNVNTDIGILCMGITVRRSNRTISSPMHKMHH